MATITSLNRQYQQLISQTIQFERQPQRVLQNDRSEERRLKGVISDFDSELSALHGQLETLSDPVANPFEGRGVASESEAFSVSASDDASFGGHTLQVERLASSDTRLSGQYATGGNALRDFFDANGSQTFSIGVATPTDDDAQARTDISVTVNPDGATDGEILKEIRGAIDTAMEDAVAGGTLKRGERASASVINETTETARLSLGSGQAGYAGRLTFADSGGGLLGQLGVNADAVAEGTGGGQVTAVGTSEADSQLNSKFTLDGLTLYRSSNRVTDAVEGLTINLREAGGAAERFEVTPDSEGIKGEVESFIEKYNGVLDFINRKSNIDGEAGTRGDFAGERTFTGLRFQMRDDVARGVQNAPAGAPARLSDLGIETQEDGTLELSDEDALEEAVLRDPDAVNQLFAGDDGLATRLTQQLDRFLGTDGLLAQRENSLDSSISRLDDRITAFDDRMARREEQLRTQYADLQTTLESLQQQQQTFSSYLSF